MSKEKLSNIFDRQTNYALRMYPCTPVIENGVQVDNLVSFQVDRPFVLLHSFTVRNTNQRDRYSNLSQGMTNALLYLDPHPIVQVMNVAEISSFHIAANRYYIEDLRPADGEQDIDGTIYKRADFEQYVFVLLCLNF